MRGGVSRHDKPKAVSFAELGSRVLTTAVVAPNRSLPFACSACFAVQFYSKSIADTQPQSTPNTQIDRGKNEMVSFRD